MYVREAAGTVSIYLLCGPDLLAPQSASAAPSRVNHIEGAAPGGVVAPPPLLTRAPPSCGTAPDDAVPLAKRHKPEIEKGGVQIGLNATLQKVLEPHRSMMDGSATAENLSQVRGGAADAHAKVGL
jgi:uncharacterized membrane-anchored protein